MGGRRRRRARRSHGARARRAPPRARLRRRLPEADQPRRGRSAACAALLERRRLQQITGLIGESEAMREVMVKVEQMAPVSSTVLIEGESGTGKELVARAIATAQPAREQAVHRRERRRAAGDAARERTVRPREGRVHRRRRATARPLRARRHAARCSSTRSARSRRATQVKLLRVLEEREFMRVGGVQPIAVDVRVVAATNQPLRELVEDGTLPRRPVLPAQRPAHLPAAAARAAGRHSAVSCVASFKTTRRSTTGRFHGISAEAMQLLVDYPWPGNVRELRNLIESMVVLSPGHEIQPDDLPRQIRDGAPRGSCRCTSVRSCAGRSRRPAASSSSSCAASSSSSFRSRSCVAGWTTTVPPLARRVDRGGPAGARSPW